MKHECYYNFPIRPRLTFIHRLVVPIAVTQRTGSVGWIECAEWWSWARVQKGKSVRAGQPSWCNALDVIIRQQVCGLGEGLLPVLRGLFFFVCGSFLQPLVIHTSVVPFFSTTESPGSTIYCMKSLRASWSWLRNGLLVSSKKLD